MKIEIRRLDQAFHLEARNESGNTIESDAAEDIGGNGKGMRPMQMLLSSLGACSAIDVIHILNRQRQPLQDIRITLDGVRDADNTPSLFTDIHVHFDVYGDLDPNKVDKAVALSMEKYCSVARILEKTARLTWGFAVHPG
ncbi:MAG TPA: OsmC family protein [Saprospiraceae bacterium]|nr:OsmC family protein [Saprospiraceae bacterium]HMP14695.1 OsmC family protein [Saprospiraceae bacterium]